MRFFFCRVARSANSKPFVVVPHHHHSPSTIENDHMCHIDHWSRDQYSIFIMASNRSSKVNFALYWSDDNGHKWHELLAYDPAIYVEVYSSKLCLYIQQFFYQKKKKSFVTYRNHVAIVEMHNALRRIRILDMTSFPFVAPSSSSSSPPTHAISFDEPVHTVTVTEVSSCRFSFG